MEWPRYPLGSIAPAGPASIDFMPSELVWHLGLEHIEGHAS